MRRIEAFVLVALLLGLSGIAIWRQAQLERLATESAALREQLAQSLAAQRESESRAQSRLQVGAPTDTGQLPEESSSPELLRLRGGIWN